MLDTIEVFKAGKHRALNGKTYEFSQADVDGMATAYDPALQAAPIVLGHPKTDDPAYGWAKGLTINDAGVLVANTEKVNPAFAEGVDGGAYRYVSAKFYAPEDPANPKPGSWYLRHIGYLGAVPPAVKGLEPAFSEEPAGELVEFAAADASSVQALFRGLRDWIIEKDGLEIADRVIPSWYIDSVEPYVPEAGSAFAEPNTPPPSDTVAGGQADDALAARAAELDTREAGLRQREVEFAERQRTDARAEDRAFVDGLVTAGRLPPAQGARTKALFARLGGDDGVAFAAPDADPRAELRELLDGLGTSIQFAEFAGNGGGFDPTSAAAAPGIAAEIQRLVSEAAARGETLSFSQAAAQLGRA